jgi:hypothetical protein
MTYLWLSFSNLNIFWQESVFLPSFDLIALSLLKKSLKCTLLVIFLSKLSINRTILLFPFLSLA